MANKVREMSVQEAMSALRQVDARLQVAAKSFASAKSGTKEHTDALSTLRAVAKSFAASERHARSAKIREVKSIDL